jgi:hypothetical protein
MKVVLLAGDKGTRISEESVIRPKPMVELLSIVVDRKSFDHAAFSTKTPFTNGLFSMTSFRSSNPLSRLHRFSAS